MSRLLVVVQLALLGGTAMAAPRTIDGTPGRLVTVEADAPALPAAKISNVLYMNRCTGGCLITKGDQTRADTNESTIPMPSPACPNPEAGCTLGEFYNAAGQTGALADDEWSALVQCVREVYSPFDVVVTDQKPTSGTYHEAIVAGQPSEIGLANDILGIALLTSNCAPLDNSISFSFANHHERADPQRVFTVCWTVTQESAHAYGLDHAYVFKDGTSTCNDPMTYRTDCGGQRFFRNKRATCGEYAERACRCGGTQNSHGTLLDVFGAGESLTPPPTVSVSLPKPDTALGAVAGATAGSQRGVEKVQLLVNGFVWSSIAGAAFGVNGQGVEQVYTLPVPANLPASKIDLVVRACDDLSSCTDSPVVPTYKGDPAGCTTADQCADHQTCDDGYCRFPAPVGEVGDACEYQQFCKSDLCAGTADQKICTQTCEVGDACPSGLTCASNNGVDGACFLPDSGGCCSASDHTPPWTAVGGSLLVVLLVRRRRPLL
ncbi:MAG TPA: MYXO-CTERM sorting domain-containing protein [Kofleriaceae bacterium]